MKFKRLPSVPRRFGIKPESLTVKSICNGVVAGMLADHFLGRSEAAYEAAIRPYVLSVAHKRGFGAFLEFPLKKLTDGRGAYKKIDAVLFYGNQTLALEIKTIREKGSRFNLQEDLIKLRRFPGEVTNEENERRRSSWQLVAWTSLSFPGIKSVQKGRNQGLDLFVQEIRHLSEAPKLKISSALMDTVPRTATLGQLILSEGSVGDFHVWCAAICVVPPSC